VAVVGVGESGGALLADQVGGVEVDGCRSVQADAAVAVLMVVVGDEAIAPFPGLGKGVEGVGVFTNATKLGLADHQPAVLISGGVVMPAVFARA
jgi:hypothetical protein